MDVHECEGSELRLPDSREKLLKFLSGLNASTVDFSMDGCVRNLEWIMADDDLATNLTERLGRSDPALRAGQFLLEFSDVLGFESKKLFKRLLHLEHVTRSLMGTHCVFKLRLGAAEVGESCLIVHLDNDLNVVMLTAAYQSLPPTKATAVPASGAAIVFDAAGFPQAQALEPFPAYGENTWQNLIGELKGSLEKYFSPPKRIIRATVTSQLWWPDWKRRCYVPALQVKVEVDLGSGTGQEASPSATEYVVHIGEVDGEVQVIDCQSRAVHASRGQLRRGMIRARPWSGKEEPSQDQKVVLWDLIDTSLGLVGTYVHVVDQFDPHWVADQTEFDSDKPSDRIMAYYHVDLLQRYFRALGLFALDECPHLMPLKIILQPQFKTDSSEYNSNRQVVLVRRLTLAGKSSPFTDAQDPLVVYHETVHAITDTLARLGRNDPIGCDNARHLKFVQAASMDEGLADYFACALAEQQGAECPIVGRLKLSLRDGDPEDPYLEWTPRRRLESKRKAVEVAKQLGWVFDKEQGYFDKVNEENIQFTIERWGNYWARFLWQLRKQLGAPIADVLIAHSIFFLTRWSDFRMGVAALIMADRLLFEGKNELSIIELSGIENRWRQLSDPQEKDDLDYSHWIRIMVS